MNSLEWEGGSVCYFMWATEWLGDYAHFDPTLCPLKRRDKVVPSSVLPCTGGNFIIIALYLPYLFISYLLYESINSLRARIMYWFICLLVYTFIFLILLVSSMMLSCLLTQFFIVHPIIRQAVREDIKDTHKRTCDMLSRNSHNKHRLESQYGTKSVRTKLNGNTVHWASLSVMAQGKVLLHRGLILPNERYREGPTYPKTWKEEGIMGVMISTKLRTAETHT